ncbi:MAG: hypothetical protein JXM79_03180 [Sedimentisphaerales bacterium]|nr:hypothetical protein [Sedimentisphaerales bacterium]
MHEIMDNNNSITDDEFEKSYVFVLNNIDVHGELPIEVAPGHFFQKASTQQVQKIKKWINVFKPSLQPNIVAHPYELDIIKITAHKQGSAKYSHEPLSEDRWRYWVIEFEGANKEVSHIESATSLLRNDLELGFVILSRNLLRGGEGLVYHGQSLFSFFDSREFYQPALSVTQEELREIPENYELIKKITPDYPHISRALRKLRDLKSLPRTSELVTIGLFSIIESLITHSPKLTESADSLTHQIKNKIPLLRKRFQRELNYDQYFNPASEEVFWSRLYKYRSCIVHGEEPNFLKDLQILKGRDNVLEFLKETVKLLLLLSLKEPVLVSDLKKC